MKRVNFNSVGFVLLLVLITSTGLGDLTTDISTENSNYILSVSYLFFIFISTDKETLFLMLPDDLYLKI